MEVIRIAQQFTSELESETIRLVKSLDESDCIKSNDQIFKILPNITKQLAESIAERMQREHKAEMEKSISAAEMIKFAEMWAGVQKTAKD